MDTVAEFLVRFREVAPQYEWHLVDTSFGPRCLRTVAEPFCCPLSSLQGLSSIYWEPVVEAEDISCFLKDRIIATADNKQKNHYYDPALWAELLRICGLEDSPHA